MRDSVSEGKAISVEIGLLTGYEERKERSGIGKYLGGGEGRGDGGAGRVWVRVEEKYITHWTPLKDEGGRTEWVVMTIAPKI